MSKFWLSQEPTTHRSVAYSPAAEALADMLHDTFRCLQFGVACAGGHALLTSGSDIGGTGWAGLGGFCFLLAAASFADIAGPTIGQVGAEWQFALESRRAGRVDDDGEPEPPRSSKQGVVRVEQWAFDGEAPNGAPNVKQAQRYELPCSPRQLAGFARLVLDGRGISEASVKQYASIGRKTWAKLQGELLNRGHIVWKHPDAHTQGVEITRGGIALCKSVLHPPAGGGAW